MCRTAGHKSPVPRRPVCSRVADRTFCIDWPAHTTTVSGHTESCAGQPERVVHRRAPRGATNLNCVWVGCVLRCLRGCPLFLFSLCVSSFFGCRARIATCGSPSCARRANRHRRTHAHAHSRSTETHDVQKAKMARKKQQQRLYDSDGEQDGAGQALVASTRPPLPLRGRRQWQPLQHQHQPRADGCRLLPQIRSQCMCSA